MSMVAGVSFGHFVLASHPPSFTSLQRAIRCNLLQRFQDLKLTSISAPHCERRSKAVDLEICPITVTPEQAGKHKIYVRP